MTDRLYYTDSYLREFDATVVEVRDRDGGAAIVLDRTAFYPTSGGQPHDLGRLGEADVTDVIDEGGTILHVTDRPLAGRVHGVIDWSRRFDHMQQHTGQHMLSQAFLRARQAQTRSVHFGADTCTLDLDIADVSPADAARVEDVANAVVFENRPVIVREVDEVDLPGLGLRRPAKRRGRVRVVEVRQFDVSACGGTHVRQTGEVGPIVIRRWERFRGGVRVEFHCGWRAVRDYRRKNEMILQLAAEFTVKDRELPEVISRLREQLRERERALSMMRDQLLEIEAREHLAQADGAPKRIVTVIPGHSFEEVAALAGKMVGAPAAIVALATPEGRIVVARSEGLDLDVASLLRSVLQPLDGRGGGKPAFAQGAVAPGRVNDALDLLRSTLEALPPSA